MLVQAIALAANFDEVAVVHEPIEKRGHCRCIAEDFRPVIERAV